MKAAVYEGPRTVTVKDVPDAKIEHPCDIIVTSTACVSGPRALLQPYSHAVTDNMETAEDFWVLLRCLTRYLKGLGSGAPAIDDVLLR
ncbi:hypothetical protein ACGFZB_03545 [Streptomyces cinerochromogenes]|uniref:Uncharacterized protein n=1 Tax=Streptomyces cinerochromogenes TaxID=66422 RepID=A0ABW7B1D7_9ACTN